MADRYGDVMRTCHKHGPGQDGVVLDGRTFCAACVRAVLEHCGLREMEMAEVHRRTCARCSKPVDVVEAVDVDTGERVPVPAHVLCGLCKSVLEDAADASQEELEAAAEMYDALMAAGREVIDEVGAMVGGGEDDDG